MSVHMVMRIKVDPEKAKAAINGADWQSIDAAAKAEGCLHHQFLVGSNGETVILDEWETQEGFQRFFHSAEEVRTVMAAAGVTEQPQIEFWTPLDTADRF